MRRVEYVFQKELSAISFYQWVHSQPEGEELCCYLGRIGRVVSMVGAPEFVIDVLRWLASAYEAGERLGLTAGPRGKRGAA